VLRDAQNDAEQFGGSTGGVACMISDGFKMPNGLALLRRR
jgi:hypothetical protein